MGVGLLLCPGVGWLSGTGVPYYLTQKSQRVKGQGVGVCGRRGEKLWEGRDPSQIPAAWAVPHRNLKGPSIAHP